MVRGVEREGCQLTNDLFVFLYNGIAKKKKKSLYEGKKEEKNHIWAPDQERVLIHICSFYGV